MRWMILALLIACSGSEKAVGVATSSTSVDGGGRGGGDLGGLFVGSEGGSGVVMLFEEDAAVVHGGGEDSAVPVEVDLDGSLGDGGVVDAGTDAEADAAPVEPQCQPCNAGYVCVDGYVCGHYDGADVCLADADIVGTCPEGTVPIPPTNFCAGGFGGSCTLWLAMYGN